MTRGLVCAAALALTAAGAAAQVDSTARSDTTHRDSTARRDTTVRDTTPKYLPIFPEPTPAGPLPRGSRYTFTADSFAFSSVQTLSDLLARIPGVYVARGGIYGTAEPVLYGGRGAAGIDEGDGDRQGSHGEQGDGKLLHRMLLFTLGFHPGHSPVHQSNARAKMV